MSTLSIGATAAHAPSANLAPPASSLPVLEWFERIAQQTPEKIAVFDGQPLSYGDLLGKSCALARVLVEEHGVRPEDRVAVFMERSAELLISLLAIFAAGAAYLPLDPALPRLRLETMVADGRPRLLLSSPRTSASAGLCETERVVERTQARITRSPLRTVKLDQLAYLLYSSGTTGRPKAAMGTHRCLSNLVEWQLSHDNFPFGARILQYSPMSFDVSLQEIFTALLSGGTLWITPDEARADLRELNRYIVDHGIQVLYLPAVVVNELFGEQHALDWSAHRLERVIVAGEQLRVSPGLRRFLQNHPQLVLHNHYGPVETHVVTGARFRATRGELPELPAIGEPISATAVNLLDSQLRPVNEGKTGEMYLAGAGVGRGYWGQPALTAERFVPNPSGEGVCYRTGDLARVSEEGELEFLRRADDQVKIKGYRVEPREVALTLLQSGLVEDAFVIPKSDGGGTRLSIYVVRRRELELAQLRRYLADRLPAYMLPSEWVVLDRLPRTHHGKVDARALAVLEGERASVSAPEDRAGPPSEFAGLLLPLWSEILGRTVGLDDDFFDLGGESLRGMQLLARVHRDLGIVLRLRELFDAPTVRGMAAIAETRSKGEAK